MASTVGDFLGTSCYFWVIAFLGLAFPYANAIAWCVNIPFKTATFAAFIVCCVVQAALLAKFIKERGTA